MMLFSHEKEGDNYEGISLLRFAYKPWHIKDKLERINVIGLEKQSVGVPKITPPSDPSTDDIASAQEAVRKFTAHEEAFIQVPEGWEAEIMNMQGGSTKDPLPTIKYYDREVMKSVLAQFLELGGEMGSGSQALSSDHSSLFLLSLDTLAKTVATVINKQLIQQLCDLNFSDNSNGYPTLTHSSIAQDNVVELADSVKNLLDSGGITYDVELEDHLQADRDWETKV